MKPTLPILVTILAIGLSACGGPSNNFKGGDTGEDGSRVGNYRNTAGYALGKDGIAFSKVDRGSSDSANYGTVAVNNYLWRASLETVGFLPLGQVDPFGGVILTEWGSINNNEKERYKINVFIFGSVLRSDAVRVKVFKQISTGGIWKDDIINPDMSNKLELTILERARAIKIAETNR